MATLAPRGTPEVNAKSPQKNESLPSRGRKDVRWTREAVVSAIRRWVELYGEPPRSSDWNPSAAKWSGQTYRIPRYLAGDPETGESWPSLNAAKKAFGGSLSAAIVAAGFEPNRSGPIRRADVGPELDERVEMAPVVRAALTGAQAAARDAEAKVEVRDRQLAAAREANTRLREELGRKPKPKVETKTKTRTKTRTLTKVKRVVDERALNRARRETEAAREREAGAAEKAMDAEKAKRAALVDATRLAARLERAEATINELRADRRELRDAAKKAADRAAAAERLMEREREREPEVVREVEVRTIEVESPKAREVREAHAAMGAARKVEEAAELRVAKAERELRELAALVTGEERRLSEDEMKALREGGPSGPSVLAAAFKELALARKRGGRNDTKVALWKVASAAVRWRDRA